MTLPAERVSSVRALVGSDAPQVLEILRADPIANCFLLARNAIAGLDPYRLGGEIFGAFDGDRLLGGVYHGANLVPFSTDELMRMHLADRLRPMVRRASSLVGPGDEVLDLWRWLEPAWGPAREVRVSQPLLAMSQDPLVPGAPDLRVAEPADLDVLLPSCVAMFTEEVGISPLDGNGGSFYRSRVAEIVNRGHAFVQMMNGEVIFKAEIGSVAQGVAQVQGVWVPPHLRRRGLATAGMAALVHHIRARIAPTVSLYVNHYNVGARLCYERVGFTRVGEFATVLI